MDTKKIEAAVAQIIEAIGEDGSREGLQETPQRIAKMYQEIFAGLGETAEEHLAKSFEIIDNNMVVEKDIFFHSMCEHHFLPFYGKVHIAYVPNGRVAGLSKLARTVEVYAKKPQIQERLTVEIAEALMDYLGAQGALVWVEAEHRNDELLLITGSLYFLAQVRAYIIDKEKEHRSEYGHEEN